MSFWRCLPPSSFLNQMSIALLTLIPNHLEEAMRRSYQKVLIFSCLVDFCIGLEALALGSSPNFP